jgi:hypothetical protein
MKTHKSTSFQRYVAADTARERVQTRQCLELAVTLTLT